MGNSVKIMMKLVVAALVCMIAFASAEELKVEANVNTQAESQSKFASPFFGGFGGIGGYNMGGYGSGILNNPGYGGGFSGMGQYGMGGFGGGIWQFAPYLFAGFFDPYLFNSVFTPNMMYGNTMFALKGGKDLTLDANHQEL